MSKVKIFTLLYFVLLAISIAVLLNIFMQLNNLFSQNEAIAVIKTQYSQFQKTAGIYGIFTFISLLIISLILYYLTNKRTYIILSNILYVGVILYVFVTANKSLYAIQNIDYAQNSEYWLTVFMGVFYIIGAILVSAIGYITIRNFTNRSQNKLNRANKKI